MPLHLEASKWEEILRWFLRGFSSQKIARETGINRWRIMRALSVVRSAMLKDIQNLFVGQVEGNAASANSRWTNQPESAKPRSSRPSRGASKSPVFLILYRGGKVWANLVSDVEAQILTSLIARRVRRGLTVFSDTWKSFSDIAAKGYVYHLVGQSQPEQVNLKGNYINKLESFGRYLKTNLPVKGGIRRHRWPLYLAEYGWRYNHRNLTIDQQIHEIIQLLKNQNLR